MIKEHSTILRNLQKFKSDADEQDNYLEPTHSGFFRRPRTNGSS